MKINLHKNATTTPAQRALIQNETKMGVAELACKLGVSETTVRRWKKRSFIVDKPNIPKKQHSALSPPQELVAILMRLCLNAGLDDLLQMVQAFVSPNCSRSALSRCLQKYEVSRLCPVRRSLPFCLDDDTGTFFHYTKIDIPCLSGTGTPFTIQTLLDCSFRWAHAEMSLSARVHPLNFIKEGMSHFPLKTHGIIFFDPIVLSDTYFQESNRPHGQLIKDFCSVNNLKSHHLENSPDNTHEMLRQICRKLRQQEAPALSAAGLKQDMGRLKRTLWIYNTRLCQRALKQKTPAQAMENHYNNFPSSFMHCPKQFTGTSS